MKCIVLSGATVPFTGLVKAIDEELISKLKTYDFDQIQVQYGHAFAAFNTSLPITTGFDFDSQIKKRIETSQLIISHAGSGSILDSVERGIGVSQRKIIVVVNDMLMDNHQLELARKLETEGCVLMCRSPEELNSAVDIAMARNFLKLAPPKSLQPILQKVEQ